MASAPADSAKMEAQFPFDAATVTEHRKLPPPSTLPPTPDLAFRLRRRVHTLSFLSPSSVLILALFVLGALHAAGLLLFTRGFLLTRLALEDINDCNTITESGNLDPSCSLPATHTKLVLLVIDALRADFVLPVASSSAFSPSPFYHNHIPLPALLTSQRPTHSFLAHFIADAPTTTLQRLKGLTTGSLPTFVDAGSNFGGESIKEDNWLAQAKRAGKRIAMVGDETWLNVFSRGEGSVWSEGSVWPYDSFNVEDLDTVDRGVVEHLLPLLDERKKDWDIIIAHSLGLDHAGHRFGADHPEATRKLRETQLLLEQVVERLDEDTLLVVMGDHGMTDRGDHGGDSRDEVEAALWVYSKGAALTDETWFDHPATFPLHPLSTLFNASTSASELGDQMMLDWAAKGLSSTRSVSQVDIVPTLSLLLGLPIPFGSLGLPIPDLFYHPSSLPSAPAAKPPNPKKRSFFGGSPVQPSKRAEEALSPLQTLLQASLLSSSQLSHYLATYTSSSAGSDLRPAMPELHFVLSVAQSAYRGAHAPGAVQVDMERLALEKFWTYGRKAREKARGIWARFDPLLMGAGLLVWIGSVVVAARMVTATKNGAQARFLVGRAVEGAFVAGWVTLALWLLSAFEIVGGLPLIWVVFPVAIGAELGVVLAPSTPRSRVGTYGLPSNWSWRNLVPLLPLLSHAALFASNSFTVFEDSAVLFLLSTLLVLTFVRALSAPEARLRKRLVGFSLTALVCVRLMAYSTICREEQIPLCHVTFHLGAGSNAALVVVGLAFVAAWIIPTILRSALALSAADTALAPAYLGILIRSLLIGGVSYWAVDWTISGFALDAAGTALATTFKTGIARLVLVGAVILPSLIWYYTPLCLRVQRETVKDASGNAVRTQVKFIGFANAFGSSYLLFFSAIFTLLFLVSPPPAQLVLTLHLATLISLLEIWDSERDVDFLKSSFAAGSIDALLNNELPIPPSHTGPTFLQISTLALLSHLSFFATGHQASLSTIQWSTAFIGFPTLVYPFSPLLVILNTLGPYILTALSIPLFVFWTLSPTLENQPPIYLLRNLFRAGASYTTYQAVVSLSSAVFAAYFRRHLMVWKVFAPRFMLGGITVLATDLVLVVLGMSWGALVTIGKVRSLLGTKVAE